MKKLAILCCLLLTMGATSAMASMTGTLYSNGGGDYSPLDTSGGMTAINAVRGALTWTVDQLGNGLWDYTYTVNPYTANKNRGIGSFNIEFGAQPTELNWDYTYVSGPFTEALYPDMYTASTTGTVQTIDRTVDGSVDPRFHYDSWLNAADPAGSKANVETTFEGIHWLIWDDNPKGYNYVTLHFTTELAPEWGNIYMDGYNMTTNNGYGFLRNTNYDIDPTAAFIYEGAVLTGWIPTPGAAAVPVPASLLLFGSGLGGLFIFKRRSQAC
jgi:hypothetical protein